MIDLELGKVDEVAKFVVASQKLFGHRNVTGEGLSHAFILRGFLPHESEAGKVRDCDAVVLIFEVVRSSASGNPAVTLTSFLIMKEFVSLSRPVSEGGIELEPLLSGGQRGMIESAFHLRLQAQIDSDCSHQLGRYFTWFKEQKDAK